MTNIILLVRDRPRLTEQTLRTLYEETPRDQFNLVIVDDGSWPETSKIIERYSRRDNCEIVTFLKPVSIVGFLRNVGIWTSERFFGRGDYLVCLDNDTAMLNHWLPEMTKAMELNPEVAILGGCRHPYHGVNETLAMGNGRSVELTDAVAGYSLMMRWETWDCYGPFASNQKGVGASEDFDLCRRISADGHRVGYINPPTLLHTGIRNTDGKPATGHEVMSKIPGIIYE